MRVIIKLNPEKFMPMYKVNNHTLQGGIYYLLEDTEFADLHKNPGFKFFTYSNVFPIDDFYPGKEKTFIISSPNDKLIKEIYRRAREMNYFYLSDTALSIKEVKTLNIRATGSYITGTPVVIQADSKESKYISFQKGDSVREFITRLKENALKKYNAFYNDELTMDFEIFDLLQFRKEVAVMVKKDGDSFVIIGSLWSLLQKKIPKGYGKFYQFLLDCGLGEKNSLGFGFLNVTR